MVLREKVTENKSFKFPSFWGIHGDVMKRDSQQNFREEVVDMNL